MTEITSKPALIATGRFRLSEDEVVAAYQLHRRATARWRIVWVAGTALVLYQFYLSVRASLDNEGWLWPTLVIGFLILFVPLERFVLYPRRVRRIYGEQKGLRAEHDIEVTSSDLHTANEYGTARQPWSDFLRWKENQALILLYQSRVMFQIFPKRALGSADAVSAVRALLAAQIGPAA